MMRVLYDKSLFAPIGSGRRPTCLPVAVAILGVGLLMAGCASKQTLQPAPKQPPPKKTTTASLTNDPYPDLRQLTPEQRQQVRSRQALVAQLRGPAPDQATRQPQQIPQAPQTAPPPSAGPPSAPPSPGGSPPAGPPSAGPQSLAPRQPQAAPAPGVTPPQQVAQAPAPPRQPPPPKKKSGGFWSWLSPISSQRAGEESPAAKLRRSRQVLANQAVDNTHVSNTRPPQTAQPVVAPPPRLKVKPKPARRTVVASRPKAAPSGRVRVSQIDKAPIRTTGSLPPRTRNRAFNPKPAPAVRVPGRSRPITVYFGKGSAKLAASANSRLRSLATLQKSVGRRVHVRAIAAAGPNGEGIEDPNALNQLAVARARAVATKLWSYGVKTDKMALSATQERVAGPNGSTLQASRLRRAEVYIE
jgi:outer membrane protein OmpA-like peptidoglycan-associated protein